MAETRICDVHKWALNDSSLKVVEYCDFCDAWICKDCEPNLILRAKALANRARVKFKIKGFF